MRMLLTSLLATTVLSTPALAGTFVFGDSSVEQGNLYALPGQERLDAPYYSEGGFSRESNGPIWAEKFAPRIVPWLGSSVRDASVNFAFSGAVTRGENLIPDVLIATDLNAQIDAYQAHLAAGAAKPQSGDVFVVAAGVNDFIRDLGVRDLRDTAKDVTANLTQASARLASLGAQRILVEDMPNFILAPAFNDLVPPSERARLNDAIASVTSAQNAAQVEALTALNAATPNTDIAIVHVSKLFEHVRANAAALGFNSIDRACYDEATGALCSTDRAVQNQYLFFDGLHLSERAQAIQADYYSALVGQLDGRANSVPAGQGRAAADLTTVETNAARAARRSSWTSADLSRGVSAIAELEDGRFNTTGPLPSSGDRRAYRLGLEYADGATWSARLVASRIESDLSHAQGTDDLEGWAVTASGERRFGDMRIGAAVSQFVARDEGRRRMPVALMQADVGTDVSGEVVDVELGYVFARDALTIVPSASLSYVRGQVDGYRERGNTGLEMRFDDASFDATTLSLGALIAYRGAVDARLGVTYERRIDAEDGVVTGRLIDNSADPIRARFNVFDEERWVIEPAIEKTFGPATLGVSARYRSDTDDMGVAARARWAF